MQPDESQCFFSATNLFWSALRLCEIHLDNQKIKTKLETKLGPINHDFCFRHTLNTFEAQAASKIVTEIRIFYFCLQNHLMKVMICSSSCHVTITRFQFPNTAQSAQDYKSLPRAGNKWVSRKLIQTMMNAYGGPSPSVRPCGTTVKNCSVRTCKSHDPCRTEPLCLNWCEDSDESQEPQKHDTGETVVFEIILGTKAVWFWSSDRQDTFDHRTKPWESFSLLRIIL